MENVYDLVVDFYENDEGWNQILDRSLTEGYLRKQAWKGVSDEELKKEWSQILMFCIYMGHGESYVGDLTADDIIDCVAWCGRNVSDFKVEPQGVRYFLEVLGELFVYLKEKKSITSSLAPYLAKEALLKDDGTMAILAGDGNFLRGEEERAERAMPDGPSKVFLNVEEAMGSLLDELHKFFQQDCFNTDLERAVFFYQGFTNLSSQAEEAESQEFWQTFWDYFLFDYHLILDDKTPLKHFAGRRVSKHQALVEELCNSRLALFSVESYDGEGIYTCKDFLTGEFYNLNLPLSPEMETKDMLVLGHIFYNKTMVMNYVRCFKLQPLSRKRLREQLFKFYDWYLVSEPDTTIEQFIARHPMVLRKSIYIAAHYLPFAVFDYDTNVKGYTPPVIRGGRDRVVTCIEKMMTPQHFSCRDVVLCMRMWLDFLSIQGSVGTETPEVWAGGIIANFIKLNRAYNYTDGSVAGMCWHMPVEDLKRASKEIAQVLSLEGYDPRYINEEGMLTMLLNLGNF